MLADETSDPMMMSASMHSTSPMSMMNARQQSTSTNDGGILIDSIAEPFQVSQHDDDDNADGTIEEEEGDTWNDEFRFVYSFDFVKS